jgi:hypothetical protein
MNKFVLLIACVFAGFFMQIEYATYFTALAALGILVFQFVQPTQNTNSELPNNKPISPNDPQIPHAPKDD